MHFSFFGSGRCAGPIGRTIFLKSISANKLFKRYLINIFCVVSLTIALIVVIVFSLYSNMQISASKAYSIGQLKQVCEMTNLLYEQMRSVSNQILQSAATNSCLSTTSFDRLKETSAAIKLREMQTANPYVRYVSFYNSASNRFVSSSTADFLTDADIEYYYDLLSDTYSDTCTLRLIGANYATQQLKTKYVYSFIFELRVRNSGDADLAIIDVDEGTSLRQSATCARPTASSRFCCSTGTATSFPPTPFTTTRRNSRSRPISASTSSRCRS